MQKFLATTLIAGAALLSALPSLAQEAVSPPPAPNTRLSPHETISAYCGGNRRTGKLVTITYGRPYSAKGGKGEARKIWGGLVKWDTPERLGSDEATLLVTPSDLQIGETTIPAGAYTLYIVASENGTSQLAFSRNIGKWGIPVDDKHDVARVNLKKDKLAPQVDQLTLALEGTPTGGILRIAWETTEYSVAFDVKK